MPLRRNVPCTGAWGPPSPRDVTRLRGIFRDGNDLLRTVFAANSHINTPISRRAKPSGLALAGGAGQGGVPRRADCPRWGAEAPRPPRRRVSRDHVCRAEDGRLGLSGDRTRLANFATCPKENVANWLSRCNDAIARLRTSHASCNDPIGAKRLTFLTRCDGVGRVPAKYL